MNTGEFYTNKETGETGRCVKTYCGSQVMDFPSRESYSLISDLNTNYEKQPGLK